MAKKSKWFSPEQDPWEPGVYERDYGGGRPEDLGYCRWEAGQWYCFEDTIEDAAAQGSVSDVGGLPWRGLATKPA